MTEPAWRQVKVWDGWVRLFHWAIVGLVGFSWWTQATDRMAWHIRSGYVILALMLFRLAWGLVGSDTARFQAFLRPPSRAFEHLRRLRRREPDTEIGHNAAGGWMVLLLLALLLLQADTGLFANEEPGFDYGAQGPLAAWVAAPTSARLTGIHDLVFNLVLAAVALHVLAVLAYAVLKGQNLVRPMLTGNKRLPPTIPAPRLGSPVLAAALLGTAALVVWGISRLG